MKAQSHPQDEPIRVLLLVIGLALEGPLGGIERFVVDLAQALDKTRISPVVFGLWDFGTPFERPWIERLAQQGIPAFIGPRKDDARPLNNLLESIAFAKHTLPGPFDIIHSHSEFAEMAVPFLAGRFRRGRTRPRLLRTVHNGGGEWRKRPLRRLLLTNGLYPLIYNQEMAVSTDLVQRMNARPLGRLLGKEGILMHNAVEVDRFGTFELAQEEARARLGLEPQATLIGAVGRLAPEKGIDLLLHALALVHKSDPEVQLLLAGAGRSRAALEALATELGIRDHVHFLGPVRNIEVFYRALDVFVSSSYFEGLPTVILEAALAGTPIVSTRTAGALEALGNAAPTAHLTPIGDVPALAEGIMAQLHDHSRATLLASAARHQVEQNFSLDRVAREHAELYTRLMRKS